MHCYLLIGSLSAPAVDPCFPLTRSSSGAPTLHAQPLFVSTVPLLHTASLCKSVPRSLTITAPQSHLRPQSQQNQLRRQFCMKPTVSQSTCLTQWTNSSRHFLHRHLKHMISLCTSLSSLVMMCNQQSPMILPLRVPSGVWTPAEPPIIRSSFRQTQLLLPPQLQHIQQPLELILMTACGRSLPGTLTYIHHQRLRK